MFSTLFHNVPNPELPDCFSCFVNESTASHFKDASTASSLLNTVIGRPLHLSTEQLITEFNSICGDIADSVAPLTLRTPRTVSQLWLNSQTRALRKLHREAERKWKKDRLEVSLEVLRGTVANYQQSVG